MPMFVKAYHPIVKLRIASKKILFQSFLFVVNLPQLCLSRFYSQANLKLIDLLEIA